MSALGSGLTTALVVESGEGVTCTVPIWDGYPITQGISKSTLAGRDITEYLQRILTERGYMFSTTAEYEIVRDIKEKSGYVALDYEADLISATCMVELERNYELPDGQTIKLSNERFRCTEAMFQPSFLGRESVGIHEMIYNSIMKSDIDLRKDLWRNIILSGGNTMFPGFRERLQKELEALAPHVENITIIAKDDRQYGAWFGASIWARMDINQNKWISRDEYDEVGPVIVHKRCL